MNPIYIDSSLKPCASCPVLFKPVKRNQDHCSPKCRLRSHYIRKAARIADEVREEVFQILCEKMVK
jgi:predicted nucleic acid-binding Zn ribbon protein